jgi:D-ribulokinase
MVVVAADGTPVAVGPSADPGRNVMVWMDHRATDQARRINQSQHTVLNYVGGSISPEMQLPKLLWLKENLPHTFNGAGHFFDLSDYMVWRATGSLARSLCTVVCKWTYLGHERRWDADFFRQIGLGVLADENFHRIGAEVANIATPCGAGLTARAAAELGLRPGVPVGTPLIDAHAGGVGSLGVKGADVTTEMAVIAGTSACTMTVSTEPRFVPGVWGPYFGAMLPDYWLNEGGQSAFGAALDYVLEMHPAHGEVKRQASIRNESLPQYLERLAVDRAGSCEAACLLGRHLHVVPEFLGNRAPEADPDATAVIAGLRLATDIESLVDLFVATQRGLACGTADVVDAVESAGQTVSTLVISGGAARSELFRTILAGVTGRITALPGSPEPVLLGAAMLGAVANGTFASLREAAACMVSRSSGIHPAGGANAQFHRSSREAYRLLQQCERKIRRLQ